VVGEACNGREAVAAHAQLRPDVTIMDIAMPEMDGVTALQEIRREHNNARVVMLTTYKGDAQILRAVQAAPPASC
jgi:two-component system NarL family response regulator